MKILSSLCALALLFAISATSPAANSGAVEVVAKEKASGKVVYHGQTGAGGKFATGNLPAGSYVFEFASKEGGFQVAMSGAKSARQIKSSGANLTFAVEIAPASKVTGKVSLAAAANTAAKSNPNVKIINGKRYVWVRGEMGSNMGGKWVPEDEAAPVDAKGNRRSASETLRKMQELGGQGVPAGR